MRNAIRDLLDLSEVPTWRELLDGFAASVAFTVLCAVMYIGGIAMGAQP